jgi:hypothetical protein
MHRLPTFHRPAVIAFLIILTVFGLSGCNKSVSGPERRHLLRRYDEFRAVVATRNAERIMQFVAPKYHEWARSRLHMYDLLGPLDERATVSLHDAGRKAEICALPKRHFLIIPGGDTFSMIMLEGEWFMGRVSID